MEQKDLSLKKRFFDAIVRGELGVIEDRGIVVTLKQFKTCFSDIKTDYINSFLPAATIEPGQNHATHTKYLFRLSNGVYLVHSDAIDEFIRGMLL
jgi:hypothetical protein